MALYNHGIMPPCDVVFHSTTKMGIFLRVVINPVNLIGLVNA